MPKSEPFMSLPVFMAIEPLKFGVQKRIFGGQYIRLGAFLMVLAYLYESGALLGRMFKDDVATIVPLIGEPEKQGQLVAFLKRMADERLSRYNQIYGEPPNLFLSLVVSTEYKNIGLVFPSLSHGKVVGSMDDFKRLERAAQDKLDINDKIVWQRVEVILIESTGFGLFYPELTWNLASQGHKQYDPEDWNRARSAGLAISEQQQTITLQEQETLVRDLVREYIQQFRPELAETLDVLNRSGLRGNH